MSWFLVSCFLALAAFLGCLGLFALAVTKVAAPDGRGHSRGVVGGCAAMLALFLLCALGLTGLAATVAALGVGGVSEWNPIRRIEISREPPRAAGGERSGASTEHDGALTARVTVRDDGEPFELLRELVDLDRAELGEGPTVHRRSRSDGGEFSVYEFRLPISAADLAGFERDLGSGRRGFELRLPERVAIELSSGGE